ncbi:MAG: TonB-dependent receptor [Bacteroidota bacterium]
MPLASRVLPCCLAALLLAGTVRAQAPTPIVWEEAPLEEALYTFIEASGVELVFALTLVRDVRVSGTYTPGEPPGPALAALLRGTGIRAERIRRGQFVLIEVPVGVELFPDDPSLYTGVLEGRVVDAGTGEALPGAHVWLVDLDLGGVADLDGQFLVESLPTGTYVVRVSHVGYRTIRVELDVFPDSPLLPPTVRLRPESVQSADAVVRPTTVLEPEPGLAVVTGVGQTEGALPALAPGGPVLGGDLTGALTLVPGISRSAGASGPMTIRGAEPGRALVVRDGVPIYAAGALGPSFQPEGLASARLHSGPLPVELEGSAGVLELETLDVPDRPRGTVAAGLGGVRGVVAMPLGEAWGVQAGWGRPAPADLPLSSALETGQALVLDPRGLGGAPEAESGATDAEARLTWRPRPGQSIEVGGYRSAEALSASLPSRSWRLRGVSEAASARYRGLVGDRTFVTALAYGSRARAEEEMGGLDTRTALTEIGAMVEVDHVFSLTHQARLGVRLASREAWAERALRGDQNATEWAVYARDIWKPTSRVELRPGARLTVIGTRAVVEPRLQARVSLVPDRLDVRAGLSRQSQAIHQLRGLAPGARDLAATRWLLATENLDPATTWLSGLGAEWRPTEGVVLGADLFVRTSRDVRLPLALADGEPPTDGASLRSVFPRHRERAAGLDLAGALRRPTWAIQGGLSLATAEVRPETSSEWTPSRYGRPVSFSLAAERTVGAGTVGARVDVESGRLGADGIRQPVEARLTLGADAALTALGVTWTLGARAEGRVVGEDPLVAAPLAPGAPLAVGAIGPALVPGVRLSARW